MQGEPLRDEVSHFVVSIVPGKGLQKFLDSMLWNLSDKDEEDGFHYENGIDDQALLSSPSFSNFGQDFVPEDIREEQKDVEQQRQRKCCFKIFSAIFLILTTAVVLVVLLVIPPTVKATLHQPSFDFGPVVNLTTPSAKLAERAVYVDSMATLTISKSLWCDSDLSSLNVNLQVKNSPDLSSEDESWISVGRLHLRKIRLPAGKRKLSLDLQNTKLSISNLEGWNAFSAQIFNEREVRWRLYGTLDVTLFMLGRAAFSFCRISFRGYHFTAEGSSVGMDSFSNSSTPAKVDQFNVLTSEYGSLSPATIQQLRLSVYNPSPFQLLPAGRFAFTMYFQDQAVSASAASTVTNVSLLNGWNTWALEGPLDPEDATALDDLASRYFAGEVAQIAMVVPSNASSVTSSLYYGGMQGLEVPAIMRRMKKMNFTTEAVLQLKHEQLLIKDLQHSDFKLDWPDYCKQIQGNLGKQVNYKHDLQVQNTLLPFWVGLKSPFLHSHVTVTDFEAKLLYGGGIVATVEGHNLDVVIGPSSINVKGGNHDIEEKGAAPAALAGSNASHSLYAQLLVTDARKQLSNERSSRVNEATAALLCTLINNGFVPGGLGISGTLSLRIGVLSLKLAFEQHTDIPCCDLHYARTHDTSTSKCAHPATDNIAGENRRTWWPSSLPTPVPSVSFVPSSQPTYAPTYSQYPTTVPSSQPTNVPVPLPSRLPSLVPSPFPSEAPSPSPSSPKPTILPSLAPIPFPTKEPSPIPTSPEPSARPSLLPFPRPSQEPSGLPIPLPTMEPAPLPSVTPSLPPTYYPAPLPSILPTTNLPSAAPSMQPVFSPTTSPTKVQTLAPTLNPHKSTRRPTPGPTEATHKATRRPTPGPTEATHKATRRPTPGPTEATHKTTRRPTPGPTETVANAESS